MGLPKVMVVIGMHRSCTSGVARGLHLAGWPMGPDGTLVFGQPENPDGFYEDIRLVRLNDWILAEQGSSWDAPPTYDRYTVESVDASFRREIVEDRPRHDWVDAAKDYLMLRCAELPPGQGQWGMKDPRLVINWPTWRTAIERVGDKVEPVIVCVWRSHAQIVQSLVARGGITEYRAGLLAAHYHREMSRHFGSQ